MGAHNLKPTVLVVEDDLDLQTAIQDTLKLELIDVEVASDGSQAFDIIEKGHIDLVLTDVNMPKMDGITLLRRIKELNPMLPVLVMSAYGTVQKAVMAIKKGALDYISKPFKCDELLKKINYYLDKTHPVACSDPEDSENSLTPIVKDATSIQLLSLARRVAKTSSSILIAGESGTGKEVLARYIHNQSPRKNENFIAINCAAIPDNMLEAILFGHEKGAFTGAHQSTPGKFEQANGGTILLDEISEMELGLQAKILRVLQEREVERIGGKKLISLDVRIIATTNRKLQEYVRQGKFREDLYYRLNVFPMQVLPLRKRQDDIIPLAKHLLHKYAESQKMGERYFDETALQRLYQYRWPGNVRELENVVQRSFILSSGSAITDSDIFLEDEAFDNNLTDNTASDDVSNNSMLSSVVTTNSSTIMNADHSNIATNTPESSDSVSLGEDLQMREFQVILQTLRDVNGRRKSAAERLGISPRTLRYKLARMRESGIVFESA